MQPTDDGTLLRQYAENHSDEAFAGLVTRHINLVYSVALRCVGDPHRAEEVTQGVFIILARKAAELRHDKALSSWLFQTTHLTARNFVRSEIRRHRREQEAHMQTVLNESGSDLWQTIAPLLDDAVAELSETDRLAMVLRFYEGKSLREVGAALDASEDAAEKRVSRAVEHLREFFAKRGVTVGASGLGVIISANSVQAAPVGLAFTISTAAALTGTTLATTATITATKAIAMTAFQKTIVTATIALLAGAGIYEARQASRLRDQNQTLQQQHATLVKQNSRLLREREDVTSRLAALMEENGQLKSGQNLAELLRLRATVASLQNNSLDPNAGLATTETTENEVKLWLARIKRLKQRLEEMPEHKIPELQFLSEREWLRAVANVDLKHDEEVVAVFSQLRNAAKSRFAVLMGMALRNYVGANNWMLPTEISQLKPYFEEPVDDTVFARYELFHAGERHSDILDESDPIIAEKAPIDAEHDIRYMIVKDGWIRSESFKPSSITISPW